MAISVSIRQKQSKKNLFLLLIALLFLFSVRTGLAQTKGALPDELKFVPANTRAIEKTFDYTVDKASSISTQQLVLDKVGFILHIQPVNKIKDKLIKLKIFSSDGIAVQTFNFKDDSIFAIVDPEKTYAIVQEINPQCDSLVKSFKFDPLVTICPDSVLIKLFDNIKLTESTSFKVPISTQTELYSVQLSLPKDIKQITTDFNFVDVHNTKTSSSGSLESLTNTMLNLASLLSFGDLCIVSSIKNGELKPTGCSFNNPSIKSIITFNHGFKNNAYCFEIPSSSSSSGKLATSSSGLISNIQSVYSSPEDIVSSSGSFSLPYCSSGSLTCELGKSFCLNVLEGIPKCQNVNGLDVAGCLTKSVFYQNLQLEEKSFEQPYLILPFLPKTFTMLNHNVILNISKNTKPINQPKEIDKDSQQKLFSDSYTFSLILDIGSISTLTSSLNRTTFSILTPVVINQELNKTIFELDQSRIETEIFPFSNAKKSSVLTSINVQGANKGNLTKFGISVNNNVLVMNLQDSESSKNQNLSFQVSANDNVKDKFQIQTYLPAIKSDVSVEEQYTFVEQDVVSMIDEKNKTTDVVTNKSKSEIIVTKLFMDLELFSPIAFDLQKPSILLDDGQFKSQFKASGILSPPSFNPIIEDGYRATITLSMLFMIDKDSTITWLYSDLKTKDENIFSNVFNFSFLPSGIYKCNIQFVGDREKLLLKSGAIKPKK